MHAGGRRFDPGRLHGDADLGASPRVVDLEWPRREDKSTSWKGPWTARVIGSNPLRSFIQMDWPLLLQKFFVYGCLGLLIEVFFTGVWSLFQKNWKATSQTYLYMLPIYGATAIALEGVSEALPWPFYMKAFLYVPIIYGIEALSGWLLQKVIGVIPWDYKKSKWTPMGLINLKYLPYWLLLALAFDPIQRILSKALRIFSNTLGP